MSYQNALKIFCSFNSLVIFFNQLVAKFLNFRLDFTVFLVRIVEFYSKATICVAQMKTLTKHNRNCSQGNIRGIRVKWKRSYFSLTTTANSIFSTIIGINNTVVTVITIHCTFTIASPVYLLLTVSYYYRPCLNRTYIEMNTSFWFLNNSNTFNLFTNTCTNTAVSIDHGCVIEFPSSIFFFSSLPRLCTLQYVRRIHYRRH